MGDRALRASIGLVSTRPIYDHRQLADDQHHMELMVPMYRDGKQLFTSYRNMFHDGRGVVVPGHPKTCISNKDNRYKYKRK